MPLIDRAVASGRVATVDGSLAWLHELAEAPAGVAGTFRLAGDACVFHVPQVGATGLAPAARHCAVHAALGHEALPSSCQHFPRVCLIDARGVRVALSHFCPTAAAMLVDDARPLSIVAGPDAVPGGRVPEGLDVRDALPPRLNDRVLMDLDALTAWEAHIVAALAGPDAWSGSVESALSRLMAEASLLARWTPGGASLVEAIRALTSAAPGFSADGLANWRPEAAYALGRSASRAPWTWPAVPQDVAVLDARWVEPRWIDAGPVVRRYLAGKAFGAWMTYQADATVSLASWLLLARTVLRVECARACAATERPLDRDGLLAAVRQADLLLVHYADGGALAEGLLTRNHP